MYEYKATLLSIYDGDTITVSIDLGFHISQIQGVRLAKINAPEIRGESKEFGQKSLAFLKSILTIGQPLVLRTYKDGKEKFGRYLAEVFIDGDNESINDKMVASGNAVYKEY